MAEIAGAITKALNSRYFARTAGALHARVLDKLKAFVNQAEKSYAQNATTVLIYLDAENPSTRSRVLQTSVTLPPVRAELESAIGVPVDLRNSDRNHNEAILLLVDCEPRALHGIEWLRKEA